jgi:fructose-1,6-bisphosphatase II / sedoheptulose-1,7-bisphosphatase
MAVKASKALDRVLVLEMVRVTEAAAIAASKLVGRGDEKAADAAAVEAMRAAFNELDFDGTVVIGEGERDEAPMLYIGEKVGKAGPGAPKIDIALDPLEGTTLTAKAEPQRAGGARHRRGRRAAQRARRLYGKARDRAGL